MSFVKFFRAASRSIASSNFKVSSCITNRPYSKLYKTDQLQMKCQLKLLRPIKETKCFFHTTQPCKVPAFLAVILKPLIRASALLVGRIVKKWYKKKSPEEKRKIIEWLKQKKFHILGFFAAYFSFILIYYFTHLEYNQWTKRKQFIVLSEKQQEKLSKMIYQYHLLSYQESDIVPKTDPIYTKVLKITANIIRANQNSPGFKDKQWTLTLTNSSQSNAYVLPGGNIFVNLGILQNVQNDDQLAIILSHEIAHEILKHPYEELSRGIITNLILSIPIAIFWATFPDLMAGIFHILSKSYEDVFFSLPHSRAAEMEADYVGLLMAAKACVDVREAVVFWGTMRVLQKYNGELQMGWLSTHPSHGDRETRLNQLMHKALERQHQVGCPALPKGDPRKLFYKLSEPEIVNRSIKNSIVQISA